jgi:hypothetical protein
LSVVTGLALYCVFFQATVVGWYDMEAFLVNIDVLDMYLHPTLFVITLGWMVGLGGGETTVSSIARGRTQAEEAHKSNNAKKIFLLHNLPNS